MVHEITPRITIYCAKNYEYVSLSKCKICPNHVGIRQGKILCKHPLKAKRHELSPEDVKSFGLGEVEKEIIPKKEFASFMHGLKVNPLFPEAPPTEEKSIIIQPPQKGQKITARIIEKYYENYISSELPFDTWRRITFGP